MSVGERVRLLKALDPVKVPEVRVASASGFMTTVELAAVNVPLLVISTPLELVIVIVEPLADKVPLLAIVNIPVVKL